MKPTQYWKLAVVMGGILGLSLTTMSLEAAAEMPVETDNGTASEANGAKIFPGENEVTSDVGYSARVQGQAGDTVNALTGDVSVAFTVEWKAVAASIGLSAEDLINGLDANNSVAGQNVLQTSITQAVSKDVLHEAKLVITPFSYSKNGEKAIVVHIVGGRDNAGLLGSFTIRDVPGTSNLLRRSLDEQDQVRLDVELHQGILKNTLVSIAALGYNWLPRFGESRENVSQGGKNSLSAAIRKGFEIGEDDELTIYFNYARLKEGFQFTRSLQGEQPTTAGDANMYAAGVRLTIDQFSVSAEGYRLDVENLAEAEQGAEVQVAYTIDKLTPYAKIQIQDDGLNTEIAANVGLAYRMLNGMTVGAMWEYNFDKESNDIYATLNYTGQQDLAFSSKKGE